MHMSTARLRLAVALIVATAAGAAAEEWPGWRGPRGDGTSTETGLPVHWSATDNVRWKVDVPSRPAARR
jgi:outer membrane protein assembly factor BamB